MCEKKVTIEQATREWVSEFNAVSSSLLERAFKDDIDNWCELTPITAGDNVYYNGDYVNVDAVMLEKTSDGLISDESKVILAMEEEVSTYLSEEELDAIYLDNEKLEITEYDFENNLFILENDVKISFDDDKIKKVSYQEIEAEVLSIEKCDDDFEFELELSQKVVDYFDVDLEHNSWLPMWGTLWTFGERLDEDWARENPDIVAKCGFRIFEDSETGDIYIGIDGAGYDFYEAHWIPLYKARGLQWHNAQ